MCVWVNPIGQMRRVAIISDVINNAQRAWDMKSDRIRMTSTRNVLKLRREFLSIELSTQGCAFLKRYFLKQSECRLTKAATLDLTKPQASQIEVVLRFRIGDQKFVHQRGVERPD